MAVKKPDAINGSARPEGGDDPSVSRSALRDSTQGKNHSMHGIAALGLSAIGMGMTLQSSSEAAESAAHDMTYGAPPAKTGHFQGFTQESEAMAAAPADQDNDAPDGGRPAADPTGTASGATPAPDQASEGQAATARPHDPAATEGDDGFLDSLLGGGGPAQENVTLGDIGEAEQALSEMWEVLLSDEHLPGTDMPNDAPADAVEDLLAGVDLSGALNREAGFGPAPYLPGRESDPEIDQLLNEIIDSGERTISGVPDPMLALLDMADSEAPDHDLFDAGIAVEGALATLFGEPITADDAVGPLSGPGGLLGGLPDAIPNEIE